MAPIDALVILRRAEIFLTYLTGSWNVLSTITSDGFSEFRDHLGTASGQLSFMYRHLEFVLGNKSRDWPRPIGTCPTSGPRWRRRWNHPACTTTSSPPSPAPGCQSTPARIIGYKPGTGGSAGVEWLEQVTRHHFFPELWAIRS